MGRWRQRGKGLPNEPNPPIPMAETTGGPTLPEPIPMLVGWAAISRFTGKAPTTLKRYKERMGFPAFRWGGHIYSHPELIFRWLQVVDIEKKRIGWKYPGRSDRSAPSRQATPDKGLEKVKKKA